MHLTKVLLAFMSLRIVDSSPIPNTSSIGLVNPTTSYSQGGNAICVSGNVPISITATTTRLLLSEPANQTVVSEIIQETLQVDSTIFARTFGGLVTTSGTFFIDTTFCLPVKKQASVTTVQLLTHGIGLDKSYWDISPGFSYVDAAALAGYGTLAYNRLGVGASDHPDPLQVVQGTVDVEIQHGLTQLLRKGWGSLLEFEHVVGVGHSYGSVVQLAQTARYPKDVDAAVLTGFVNNLIYLGYSTAANNPSIAALNSPSQWGGLPYGYIVHDTAISIQLPYFRAPYYPAATLNEQVAHKQPYTIGQELTLGDIYSAAPNFTGPVDIVIGQHDFPFCLGECDYPSDLAAATIPELYPAASSGSESFIVPNSGHLINAHYEAGAEFSQINNFLLKNGF